MSPWFALGLAPALQPWVLIGAGAATVVEAKLSSGQSFLALVVYCLLASSSYLAMEIYAVFRPGQSQALLARFRTWIDTHTDQVIIVGEPDHRLLAHRQQPLPDRHLRQGRSGEQQGDDRTSRPQRSIARRAALCQPTSARHGKRNPGRPTRPPASVSRRFRPSSAGRRRWRP